MKSAMLFVAVACGLLMTGTTEAASGLFSETRLTSTTPPRDAAPSDPAVKPASPPVVAAPALPIDEAGPEDEPDPEPIPETAPETAPQAPEVSAGLSAADFVGVWSAKRSKTEAFAIRFLEAGTFLLVYVNGGSQVRSTGKFTIVGQELKLIAEGLTLAGEVAQATAESFELTLSGQPPLTFERAKS